MTEATERAPCMPCLGSKYIVDIYPDPKFDFHPKGPDVNTAIDTSLQFIQTNDTIKPRPLKEKNGVIFT